MRTRRNKRGIILVEILIALAIIVFTSIAIIQAYISGIALSQISKDETVALSHLTNIMEAVKCTPFNNIAADFPDGIPDGPTGIEYAALAGGYVLSEESIVVNHVNPGGDPLEIIASLSWRDKRGATRTKYLVTKRTE